MSDKLGIIWECKAHTVAKHAILKNYLKAWFPILTRQSARVSERFPSNHREIMFIDGFAGPGAYSGGEPGSPAIALQTALDHTVPFPYPLRMLFIEKEAKRFEHLTNVIQPLIEKSHSVSNVIVDPPEQGDCDAILNQILDERESREMKFGPALVFLDQFGYGAVSMDLIGRIMSNPQCEVFSYLNYKDMNRWITDPNKESTFTKAFGNDEWKGCRELPEVQRREKLLRLYKNSLNNLGNTDYVNSFLMFDEKNRPLYWLFFCTNSLRGLEEMKRAMWKVDATGSFRFSDRDCPEQLDLLERAFDKTWLCEELKHKLGGKTLSVQEIKKFVLTETPCHKFKLALKSLEIRDDSVSVVESPPARQAGTYADEYLEKTILRFEKQLF